ncbi:hypothetical protein NQ318_020208 [Aromia moschata]|uniref:Dipeptidylpeptidase IV N-terminal domain-containing protein n=1 Tax=Aromia moschata TaxID=1265417 RepID=A0AAV8ZC31_9CUCU|nr:hypothetical protein NQ318_020208 [Aromia moschata]
MALHGSIYLFRHSYKAVYAVVDLSTGEKSELITENASAQLAVWAPVGNAIAYVFENNIYYKKLGDGRHSYPDHQHRGVRL